LLNGLSLVCAAAASGSTSMTASAVRFSHERMRSITCVSCWFVAPTARSAGGTASLTAESTRDSDRRIDPDRDHRDKLLASHAGFDLLLDIGQLKEPASRSVGSSLMLSRNLRARAFSGAKMNTRSSSQSS